MSECERQSEGPHREPRCPVRPSYRTRWSQVVCTIVRYKYLFVALPALFAVVIDGLPPLRENCNISAVPIEWPCDIQNDPTCSLEKFGAKLSE